MPARLLGAHMPAPGGLKTAVATGAEIGCTALQVFTSSPQQWKAREVTDEAAAEFKAALAETRIEVVVSHDSYLVNLAAPDPGLRQRSAQALAGELHRCSKLGIPLAVSHIGAHMGQGEGAGLRIAAEGIREVLESTPPEVTLLMETTAGQGSALNWRFEQIASLLDMLGGHARLGVCLDTCHVFAAGYDIRSPGAYEDTFSEFQRLLGTDRLKAIHANDSKKGLGSRVDRHEHIGQGEIGLEGFRMLVNDQRFERVPIVIETPDAPEMHGVNLERLRGLRRE
jgi:deoxyribonuclease-4